jgi:hypothetical protein
MTAAQLAYSLLETDGEWTPEGYTLVAAAVVGDYDMKLWQGKKHIKGEEVKFNEISLNRHGLSFDPDSQHKRQVGGHHALGHRHEFLDLVRGWISKYGTLLVGSYNPEKLTFYHRLLSRYLPRIYVSDPFPAFDESEGVNDYFTIGSNKHIQPVGESMDNVDPQRYIDDLPSTMDRMKAAALERYKECLPSMNRDNFCDWADEIAGAIVYEFMQPAQLVLVDNSESVNDAFQELSAYLVKYGDSAIS